MAILRRGKYLRSSQNIGRVFIYASSSLRTGVQPYCANFRPLLRSVFAHLEAPIEVGIDNTICEQNHNREDAP